MAWMRCWVAMLALAGAHASIAHADTAPRFAAADVFRLKSVGEVRISPDGRTVAYEAIDTDIAIDGRRRSIRLIDVASGVDRLLAADARSPRWSADGRWLAYADRAGGQERLMRVAAAGGTPRVVAAAAEGASGIAWSPDGRALAFVRFVPTPVAPATPVVAKPAGAQWAAPPRLVTGIRHTEDGQGEVVPGFSQLFVVAADGATPARQVTDAPLEVGGAPSWTADGRALVYGAANLDRFGADFRVGRLFRVPATGGTPVALTPASLSAFAPAVSPDGRRLAFIAFAVDGRDYSPLKLRVADLAGGESRVVEPALDRDIGSVMWSADGRYLYAGYVDRSVGKLRRIPVDGGAATDVASGLADDASVGRDGTLAYASASPDRPAEVALLPAGGGERRLTRRNDALLAGRMLGTTTALPVRSTLDGASVGAWLTRPAETRGRDPLIVDLHGGPYGADGPEWRVRDQLYAAAGYAVLHVNYRGSTSYGFAFADRIARDPLEPSYVDVVSAVDAAVAAGVADPQRLFVTGGSAGGALTAWTVGRTTRFRAAMAEKPIVNEVAQVLSSDQYYTSKLIAGPAPWQDAERRWSRSPLSLVGRVSTPTMLMVGEEDRRTPPTEALQFYHALTLRGVPSALVLVPGASHSSLGARPSQLVEMVRLTLEWFGTDHVTRR